MATTTKNSTPSTSSEQIYEPTPQECETLQAFFARTGKDIPRIKVTGDDTGPELKIDHPDLTVGQLVLMEAIGTTQSDFYVGLIKQLANVGSRNGKLDENGINFMLAIIKGIEPRDQVEAMLAAQMAAVHNATMTLARRLASADNIVQQDSSERAFNKLARTFATQISALKDYRSKREQKITVQHINVAEGGQAVIGNVGTPTAGVGTNEKTGEQPHAKQLAYAPGIEMPRQIEEDSETVPISRCSGA